VEWLRVKALSSSPSTAKKKKKKKKKKKDSMNKGPNHRKIGLEKSQIHVKRRSEKGWDLVAV
jgi:hypothetical protein